MQYCAFVLLHLPAAFKAPISLTCMSSEMGALRTWRNLTYDIQGAAENAESNMTPGKNVISLEWNKCLFEQSHPLDTWDVLPLEIMEYYW